MLAVSLIGGHEKTGVALAGYLNLPPPTQTYSTNMKLLAEQATTEARRSMQQAADEVKAIQGRDIRVSVDGTWQRRGYSSKQGVVTVLSNLGQNESNKVIDTEVLSTFCHTCLQTNNDNIKLSTIKKGHTCAKNHDGSAGSMEVAGAVKIFGRSKDQYGLQYTEYLGDGDSKAYATVASSNIYSKPISKLECCGHIQKRMGKALMRLVDDNKSKVFIVNQAGVHITSKTVPNKSRGERLYRGIGGQGRLTSKAIKSIQGHYGAAIRNNADISSMKADILAILQHRKGLHESCPEWCPSHRGNMDAANKSRLPMFVCKLMEPVFEYLSSDELLSKCVHGGTQNANESFHNLIWKHCPKGIFAGITRIQLGVSIATIMFNDGARGMLGLYNHCGLRVGRHLIDYVDKKDTLRVKKADIACKDTTKAKRKASSYRNAATNDYEAGAF